MADEYTSEDFELIKPGEHIRRRPSMYIGDVELRGLFYLVKELVLRPIKLHGLGNAAWVRCGLLSDGGYRISDDGSWYPLEIERGHSHLEWITLEGRLTGQFPYWYDNSTYTIRCGLHSPNGEVVASALSEQLVYEIHREGKVWRQCFSRGKVVTPLEVVGETSKTEESVTFYPDPDIFKSLGNGLAYEAVEHWFRDRAYLNAGLEVSVIDERAEPLVSFTTCAVNGLRDMVEDWIAHAGSEPVHSHTFHLCEKFDRDEIDATEIALRWVSEDHGIVLGYVNGEYTPMDGTHVTTLMSSIGSVLCKESQYSRGGLVGAISVRLASPRYENGTKERLSSPEISRSLALLIRRRFGEFLREHPLDAEAIVRRIKRGC